MKPAPFRYERPSSLEEALRALEEAGDEGRVLAGGQSLVPMLNMRLAAPSVLVDVNAISGLDEIATEGEGEAEGEGEGEGDRRYLVVGALARQRTLERSALAASCCPVLPECLSVVGHVPTRNRGTVGGSIAHADPAGELPVALLALGGEVEVAGPDGVRRIGADDLFVGFLTTSLGAGEMLVRCRFPARRGAVGSGFAEVAPRHGDFAFAIACASVALDESGRIAGARLALGAVADRPLLVPAAGDVLGGSRGEEPALRAAAAAAQAAVDPADSLHAPAGYRRHLVGVLAGRALRQAVAKASEQLTKGGSR